MTAQDPDSVPRATAPPNTFSYIAIACGVLALLISWLIFGVLGVALALVARGRREQRWTLGLATAAGGMVLGLISILISRS